MQRIRARRLKPLVPSFRSFTRTEDQFADARSCAGTQVTKADSEVCCRTQNDAVSRVCFLLFCLGGIAGILQFSHPLPFGLGYEMVAIGKNLAVNGTFGNPFGVLNTGPTAVNPPLYPFFLGILFKFFGSSGFVIVAAAIGNIVMNALAASWLPRVSLVAFGSIAPGVFAGILWLVAVELMPAWDASYTAAGLILFCWYSASAIQSKRPVRAAVMTGLLAGTLILLNPSSVIVLLPWLAYLVLIGTGEKRRSLLFASATLAVMCVPVSLWIVRNFLVLGAPVLRTNLGMTLYVSNNDCAEPSLVDTARVGCYQRHHPNESILEAQALRSQGEVNYDRSRVAESISWMASNSTRFRQLTITRFLHFWFPQAGQPAFPAYAIWAGTALSVLGLIFMIWRREPVTPFIAFVLCVYPLMYYLVVTDIRYRYPVLWLSFMAAGYLLHSIFTRSSALEKVVKERLATSVSRR